MDLFHLDIDLDGVEELDYLLLSNACTCILVSSIYSLADYCCHHSPYVRDKVDTRIDVVFQHHESDFEDQIELSCLVQFSYVLTHD